MVELVQFLFLLSIGQPVAEGYHSNTSHDHTETTTFGTTLKRWHLEPHWNDDIWNHVILKAYNIWKHTTFGTTQHLEPYWKDDIWNHTTFGTTWYLEAHEIWNQPIFGSTRYLEAHNIWNSTPALSPILRPMKCALFLF